MIPPARLTLILLLVLPALVPAHAESRLIFPRMVFQQDRYTGIAIANPNATEAAVTFTAYRPDGTLLSGDGVKNPVTKSIAAGSQYAVLATQVFEPPASVVNSATPVPIWVQATSPVNGLTGFFLDLNGTVDFLDGSDLAGIGADLVVPFVENTGGSTTELAIVNPDSSGTAAITADLVRADGSVVSTQSRSLGALQALQATASSLFPGDYAQVATIRLRSNRPLASMAFISRQPDNSLVVIAAQSAANPARTLYFPQLAQGQGWATSVGLVNLTGSPVVVTLSAYQPDGTLFPAPAVRENPVARSIPAGGQLRADMGTLFGFGDAALEQGWLKVEASEPAINGFVEYGAGTNRALVSAQLEAVTKAVFSHQANSRPEDIPPRYFTGVAVLNPGSLAANVELVALSATSQVLGKTRRVIRASQRASLLVPQWLSAAQGAVGGAIFLKSDVPVIATQLFGTENFTALSNVPPQPLSTDFDPGASLPTLRVSPPVAVIETGKSLNFTATGGSVSQWAVNGVTPGSASVGSVSSAGRYTAPAIAPPNHSISVEASASGGELAAAAAVDVVQREALTGSLTLLTSVAYFTNLQRFFIAEQQVLSSAPSGGARFAQTINARISEVTPEGTVQSYVTIPGETVPKMIAFKDSAGQSHLLLAGVDTGNVYRLTVGDDSKTLTTIATGLARPNSLALDPVSGDLWVAESGGNQVTVIERSRFDSAPAAPSSGEAGEPPPRILAAVQPRGIAFDPCIGSLFVVSADGAVREFLNNRERVVYPGGVPRGQILVLQRTGYVSCADAVTLFVAEPDRVAQIDPRTGQLISFIDATNAVTDLTFLDRGSPFSPTGEEAIIVAEGPATPGQSRVVVVPVGSLYQDKPAEGGIFEGGYPGGYPGGSSDGTYDGRSSDIPGFDAEPGTEYWNAGNAVVYRDRVGDAFGTELTRQARRAAPDIASISAYGYGTGGVVSVTFTRPVAPASAAAYNSLAGWIDFDTQPGNGVASHSDPYNPLRRGAPETDAYIDLSRGVLSVLTSGGPSGGVAAAAEYPVAMAFLGNTVTVVIPGVLDVATSRLNVTAGNAVEVTDIAPESRFMFAFPRPSAARTVQFTAAASSQNESSGSATVEVSLSSASSSSVTVQYYPAGGSATLGVDYRLRPGTLTFAPGQTRKQITVPIIPDALRESNETVFIGLRRPAGAVLGSINLHTLAIIDSEVSLPAVQFSSASSNGSESVASPSITVTLSAPALGTVTVGYSVSGGTATGNGVDYSLPTGSLTFEPGQTSKSFGFTVVNDLLDEPNETIVVTLVNPDGALLGATRTHTYTILDDDTAPTLQFAQPSSSGSESTTSVPPIAVTLSAPAATTVTVNYAVTGGTARPPGPQTSGDYSFAPGTLTFAPGETSKSITFTVVNDTTDEPDETVIVGLSGVTGGATLGSPFSHTYTIVDDDASLVSFAVGQSSGSEAPSVTVNVTVNLSPASSQTVTVPFSFSGTATPATSPTSPGDYTVITGSPLSFAPGETSKTISVSVTDDSVDESNETIVITLGTPSNASLGSTRQYTYTINDDDPLPVVSYTSSGATVSEGVIPNTVTVTVALSTPSGRTVTVNYSVSPGYTATPGSDFILSGSTLTFLPGQVSASFTITIVNDLLVESTESAIISLSGLVNCQAGQIMQFTLNIRDNDIG